VKVIAIIPAAGLGTRMAAGHVGSPSKQFLSLGGEPVLMHTLRRFLQVPQIASAVVAVRASELANVRAWIEEVGFNHRVKLVEGGEKRQDTVFNALQAIEADENDIVLVHDAVRPLISLQTIEHCIQAVEKHGAAIVGLPAVDTVKIVNRTAEGAIISTTEPRERVVMAQTPQGFRFGLLKNAVRQAMTDGFVGTDEASLLERSGHEVAVVMGSPANFKITNPGDLELAEFFLARERKG
jgi:2-C-methyl-D-erythritol 4-phosphate cytidylyltransferase